MLTNSMPNNGRKERERGEQRKRLNISDHIENDDNPPSLSKSPKDCGKNPESIF
jgi:hypothetical protein